MVGNLVQGTFGVANGKWYVEVKAVVKLMENGRFGLQSQAI